MSNMPYTYLEHIKQLRCVLGTIYEAHMYVAEVCKHRQWTNHARIFGAAKAKYVQL